MKTKKLNTGVVTTIKNGVVSVKSPYWFDKTDKKVKH